MCITDFGEFWQLILSLSMGSERAAEFKLVTPVIDSLACICCGAICISHISPVKERQLKTFLLSREWR
jgi:hypothetical protein